MKKVRTDDDINLVLGLTKCINKTTKQLEDYDWDKICECLHNSKDTKEDIIFHIENLKNYNEKIREILS